MRAAKINLKVVGGVDSNPFNLFLEFEEFIIPSQCIVLTSHMIGISSMLMPKIC